MNQPTPLPATDILNIDVDAPTSEEIIKSINAINTDKAVGINFISAEMLKADLLTLTILFRSIWNGENVPNDGAKDLIVKISKKDL